MTNDEPAGVGPGTVLADRYELTGEIGRGGFGMVFKARQLNMDRDVAVKILPPRFMTITDVVERFKREARLCSRLRHPNTITLHDYGQQDDLLFIVMELLTGEDLADALKREGRMPIDRTLHVAKQVLKSLAEAHEEGIVHRDLKPENIFLSVLGDDEDVVKVLDFGIAKLAAPTAHHDENQRSLTISGSTVGTPTYMSPEQAAGEDVDGTTDLYALGIIMYEMLNGRPPFYNRDPVKVMRAQLFDSVPPLRDSALQGTLIDRVIRKALHKDREGRFQTANEFLLALAGAAVARPVVAGIDIRNLVNEPAEDFQDPAPNTEDIELSEEDKNAFEQTLQFADSVQRTGPDDSIPFGIVAGEAPREKATVRSDLNEDASITGGSLRMDQTSSSSILTVTHLPISSPEDKIILLTTPKSDPTITKASTAPASMPTHLHERDVTPAPQEAQDDWSWGVHPEHTGHDLDAVSRKRSGQNVGIMLFVLAVAIVAAAAYMGGYLG